MEKNVRMLVWGSVILLTIFLIALMPFWAHATSTFPWSKLGGAPMIRGGIENQDDFIKKLGNPAIQKNYIEGFKQAYPGNDAEMLFRAFQLVVESSTLQDSSYQSGTIFPDGMFFKPKKGVYYEKRPVEWCGAETLESLEVPFCYEDKEFLISVIKKCGNVIPWKSEEEKPARKAEVAPTPQSPQIIEKRVEVEKEKIVEVPVRIEVPVEVPLSQDYNSGYYPGQPAYYNSAWCNTGWGWGYNNAGRYYYGFKLFRRPSSFLGRNEGSYRDRDFRNHIGDRNGRQKQFCPPNQPAKRSLARFSGTRATTIQAPMSRVSIGRSNPGQGGRR